MTDPLVFGHAFEGLFVRGLKGRLDAAAKKALLDAGLDFSKPLLPAYPLDTWMKCIAVAAQAVFPSNAPAEGRFELGRRMIRGYGETYLGKAILAVVKLVGPRRALARAAHSFRSANNYTETRLTETGQTCAELWMNEVGPYPEFTAGIVAAGVEVAGGRDVKVDVAAYDGHAVTYRVTWSP